MQTSIFYFMLLSLGLLLTPGADTMLITRNTLTYGKNIGYRTALGTVSGASVHVTCAVIGITALLASSPIIYEIVKYAGALYLAYLGIQSVRSSIKGTTVSLDPGQHKINNVSGYRQAFLTNILNPKVALFFFTFFPQFVTNKHQKLPHLALLGTTFLIMAISWELFYVYMLGFLRPLFQKKRVQIVLNFITGIVLMVFSLELGTEMF